MPQPTFDDIRRFCEIDGWEAVSRVRGGTGDHWRYRKVLDDGSVLRTRASHSREQIGDPGLWRHIWRDQLGLESEDQFWESVRTRRPVDRRGAAAREPGLPGLPAWVVDALIRQAGVAEEEVRRMSEQEARKRLHEFWSSERSS